MERYARRNFEKSIWVVLEVFELSCLSFYSGQWSLHLGLSMQKDFIYSSWHG